MSSGANPNIGHTSQGDRSNAPFVPYFENLPKGLDSSFHPESASEVLKSGSIFS
jgi:hypothetical protein